MLFAYSQVISAYSVNLLSLTKKMTAPVVVIDNGTGYFPSPTFFYFNAKENCRYSKLGFAGNTEPQYTFPTIIATREGGPSTGVSKRGLEDLDFFIGDEALKNSKSYGLTYPMKHGQVENWDYMERLWEQCIFKYLRCEPEDHFFLLVLFYSPPQG